MQIEIEPESIRLLDWLYDQPDTKLLYDVNEYVTNQGFSDDSARLLVEHLANQGLVMPAVGISGQADAMITAKGITYIQRLRARRSDPAMRIRTLQSAMLRWLFNQEHSGRVIMDWSGFIPGNKADLISDQFDLGETEREAGYLASKNLITGADVDQKGNGAVWPKLTPAGRDCVMDFEGNVAEYIKGQRGNMTNHINMTGNSGNFMVASNNSQQNVTTGIDTDALVKFATAIRDSMPILNLATEEETELGNQAQELDELANSTSPPKGRMRQLVDALMAGLTKAASPVATAIAASLGNDALRALGQ